MDLERQKLLDRIAKLLSLADNNLFSAEANSAREMAYKLMYANNINLSEARRFDDVIERIVFYNSKSKHDHKRITLYNVIATFCGCSTSYSKEFREKLESIVTIYGRSCDIDATEYLTDVCQRQINDLKEEYKLKNSKASINDVNAYHIGLIHGISKNLHKLTKDMLQYQQNKTGLVPLDETSQRVHDANEYLYSNKNIQKPRSYLGRANVDRNIFYNGINDSDKIKINAPIKDKSNKIHAIGE